MPPRKSTDSAAAAQNKSGDGDADTSQLKGRGRRNSDSIGVEDLNLPRSMVQRLAKGMLPPNTSIHKEALLAMSKSATVFVNYLASNANDRAVLNKKKTIQPNDVFDALDELEFPEFLPRVKTELEIWNTAQCDKRNSYRRRIREEAAAKDGTTLNGVNGNAGHGGSKQDGGPPAHKKARLSTGATANDDDDDDMGDDAEEGDGGDETIDEHDEEEDEDNLEDDEDAEDDAPEDDEQDDGLEGDMSHTGDQDDEDEDDESD